MSWLRLMDSAAGMILLFMAQGIPFSVFLLYGFIKGIPRSLDEAAILDGCGSVRLFFRVIFPLLKPVFVTGFVLNFMNAWNDFITPLYVLNKTSSWGMIMSIYNFFGLHGKEWNLISAVIIVTVVPILIVYLICQRYIIAGMTSGAVKG
jgi:raffinose/stachyose/melibiose transport system permease protein